MSQRGYSIEGLSAPPLPAAFGRHIRETFGADGEAWLRRLPSLVVDLAARWELTLGEPTFELSYNYVVPVTRTDRTPAVLKIGVPLPENRRELTALRAYDGDGACRVMEFDVERCAMLLERVLPGDMLVRLVPIDDERATRIGASVLRKLWRPVPNELTAGFRPLAEWFAAFDRHRQAYGGAGPLPRGVFEAGVAITETLLASAPAPVLLHADFHHYNVLAATRAEWLAIDPKGMLGDRGYDVGPFMCNPRPSDGPLSPRMLQRRLDILADELEYDRARLRDWAIAYAVLSACWSAESHSPPPNLQLAVNVAEMLLQ